MPASKSRLPEILKKFEQEILREWVQEQVKAGLDAKALIKEDELRSECADFLKRIVQCIEEEGFSDIRSERWATTRELLWGLSRQRAQRGFSPSEVAMFVFSLKRPVFARLRREIKSAETLGEEVWNATQLLDGLGLFTTEVAQKMRDDVIARQQEEMMELSTPVVKLWDGILAVPLIGTLDSARTQVVMEALLRKIVETGSSVAIIDITGVPTVDTLVAQHLLKTVTAARLMGADCIISGIRPQIAQTIVHLGVSLNNVSTKASLADAFALALQRGGFTLRTAPVVTKETL